AGVHSYGGRFGGGGGAAPQGDGRLSRGEAGGPGAADDRGGGTADRAGVAACGGWARSLRLRARSLQASGGVRSGGGAGRVDDGDGADGESDAVHLLPAQ